MSKIDRAAVCNSFLECIASCGRRFFFHKGTVSRFEIDERGRIWFVDSYSEKRIYVAYRHGWRGFTNGGTLRTLVQQLRDYIRTGERPRLGLGPWPSYLCDGDLWGYGDAMQAVRDKANELWPNTPEEVPR